MNGICDHFFGCEIWEIDSDYQSILFCGVYACYKRSVFRFERVLSNDFHTIIKIKAWLMPHEEGQGSAGSCLVVVVVTFVVVDIDLEVSWDEVNEVIDSVVGIVGKVYAVVLVAFVILVVDKADLVIAVSVDDRVDRMLIVGLVVKIAIFSVEDEVVIAAVVISTVVWSVPLAMIVVWGGEIDEFSVVSAALLAGLDVNAVFLEDEATVVLKVISSIDVSFPVVVL